MNDIPWKESMVSLNVVLNVFGNHLPVRSLVYRTSLARISHQDRGIRLRIHLLVDLVSTKTSRGTLGAGTSPSSLLHGGREA